MSRAKGRVRACEIQLRASQSQASQIPELARAKIRKFTQQINDRLPLAVSELCEAIEGRERDGGSVLENDVHARHPIGLRDVEKLPRPGMRLQVSAVPGGIHLFDHGHLIILDEIPSVTALSPHV